MKTSKRRTSAEVQQERDANAKAKASRENAKKKSIVRTAQFEHSDRLDEDASNATPRPSFTPKAWPPSHNSKNAKAKPRPAIDIESSDIENTNNSDTCLEILAVDLPRADHDSAADLPDYGSAAESDPPSRKQKAKLTGNPKGKGGAKSVTEKAARKRRRENTPPPDEEETPKQKKVKPKMRDEIDKVLMEVAEADTTAIKKRGGDMVKSASAKIKGKLDKQSAPKDPSGHGGKKLKREGAMLKITKDKATPAHILKGSGDGISDIDRFVFFFSHFLHVSVVNA